MNTPDSTTAASSPTASRTSSRRSMLRWAALGAGTLAVSGLAATGASAAPGRSGGPTGTVGGPNQMRNQWGYSYQQGAPTIPAAQNTTTAQTSAATQSSAAASTSTATATATSTATTSTASVGTLAANGTYGSGTAAQIAGANLSKPLSSYTVTSTFGPRNYLGYTDNHTGIDLVAPQGTTVMAAQSGTVTFAGWHQYGGGNRVEISHGNGVVTTYNHMSKISVSQGQTISKGGTVGAVGATGNATGAHLHFEVIANGAWTNPQAWLTF